MVPGLNPLSAPTVICPNCSSMCPPEPITGDPKKGVKIKRVHEVRYCCVNPETNCSWEVKATLSHIMGEGPFNLKPEELERRRKEQEELQRFRALRENAISELVHLLPRIKDFLFSHAAQVPAREIGATPPPQSKPTPDGQQTGTESADTQV